MAALNAANLAWTHVIATSDAIFPARRAWTYTDTGRTLAQLENDQGDTTVAKLLRDGDVVKVIGSDGNQLAVIYDNNVTNPTFATVNFQYVNLVNLGF